MARDLNDVLDADIAKDKKTAGQTPPSTTGKDGKAPVAESPAGTTAISNGSFFEGEILAYRELSRIAQGIAGIVKRTAYRRLILYDKRDVEALPVLEAFRVQAQLIRDQYREIPSPEAKVETEAALEILTTATTLANAFLGFIGLFRSDVEVHGREITLDEVALIAELADQLNDEVSVIYPTVGPVPATEKIWALLEELTQAKAAARQRARGNAVLEARVDVIDSQLDNFLQTLMKPDATSGSTLLATLARAEALQEALQDGQILFLKIVRAGAGRRLIENFWTRIFYSDRISHSGGAVVTFMVLDKTGRILLSRTLYSHSGYTKFNEGIPRAEWGRNFTIQ